MALQHPSNRESADWGLLSLPAELRNTIYHLILKLEEEEDGLIYIFSRPRTGKDKYTHSVLALLRTCKQVYRESIGIFYNVNAITIRNTRLLEFIDTMSAQRLDSITQIGVHDPESPLDDFTCFQHLSRLPNHETLHLVCGWPGMHREKMKTKENTAKLRACLAQMSSLRKVHVLTYVGHDFDFTWKPLTRTTKYLKQMTAELQDLFDELLGSDAAEN